MRPDKSGSTRAGRRNRMQVAPDRGAPQPLPFDLAGRPGGALGHCRLMGTWAGAKISNTGRSALAYSYGVRRGR